MSIDYEYTIPKETGLRPSKDPRIDTDEHRSFKFKRTEIEGSLVTVLLGLGLLVYLM